MNQLTLFESPQFGQAKIAPTETLEQLTSGMITVNQARKNFGLDLIKEPSADCKLIKCN
jgi:hypothetical protein